MPFSPAELLPFIAHLTPGRCLVAYSGGVDSHVLLHAMAQLRPQLPGVELRAIHVDHGLHSQSASWALHCMQVCSQMDVPCDVLAVDARASSGTSPEAAARAARYAAFKGIVRSGDLLLTAHHQDDQAETLLLQLLRGAGPRGLAGMAKISRFGAAWLARPLLEFPRAALKACALAQQLRWIDDPSNSESRFDRNYLRHEILPALQRRWPAAPATLARSAQHCAEAAELLEELAQSDLQTVHIPPPEILRVSTLERKEKFFSPVTAQGRMGAADSTESHPGFFPKGAGLSISRLLTLSPARQRNVLRFWIEQASLPPPQQRHVERLRNDVLHAAADAEPCVHWPGAEVRRYRDALYAMPPLTGFSVFRQQMWDLKGPLRIAGAGLLSAYSGRAGLRSEACAAGLQIGFRKGGERIRPTGRAHHATLKNLFQEAGVPPWRRDRVPLLYIDGSLAAVAGFWYAQEFAARADAAAIAIDFQPE